MKKAVAILLALSILSFPLIFASCVGDGGDTGVSDTAAETSATEPIETEPAETAREDAKDSLPELDFDGAKLKVTYTDSHGGDADAINWTTEDTGDIVVTAQYERIRSVEERLNISFEIKKDVFSKMAASIRENVLAGNDAYDIIDSTQSALAPLVTESLFVDLIDAKYLDWEQPWWANDYMDEMMIGNHRFFLLGDISLSMLSYMSCMYFNKDQFTKISGGETDDILYGKVLDGAWTIDELSGYVKKCYADLNGDGIRDEGDQYGVGVVTASTTDHMVFDSGIRLTSRDKDGIPYISANNEKTVSFSEKLYSLFYENEGAFLYPATQDSLRIKIPAKFIPGEMTFMFGYFYSAVFFRDMETDYGIIPYPKLDETIENYGALVHNSVCMLMVPVTCGQLDIVCAALEASCAENYRTVTPVYYEVALKTKYIRDDISGQIVDMIHASPITDLAYVYSSSLNNFGTVMRTLMEKKTKDFASLYASASPAAEEKLALFIEAFKAMG